LETLLLPERGRESEHLLLTAAYKKKLIETFPHKFPTQARPTAPAVSRPGPQGTKAAGSKPKAKTEADLPPSARSAMEHFIKQGVLTKDQYLKDYEWDD
jgi:hypothetical protein